MFCTNCGKELPQESSFCPYCMTKFVNETKEAPLEIKKKKFKTMPLVIVALLCVVAIIAGAVVVPVLKGDDGTSVQSTENNKITEATTADIVKNEESEDDNSEASAKDDVSVGLMNIKINGEEVRLNETQELLVQYFDKDYFRAPYSSLQRYPQVYKGAQINFLGYVTKVIENTSTEYTLLVEYEAWKTYDGVYMPTEEYVVIKGSHGESRIVEGDTLYVYGKYNDVDTYKVDNKSYTVPTISVNRYTYFYYMDSVEPMYSMEEIRSIAKYIFGDDIKIRYTKDEDFEENSGWGYYEDGLHYTVELDDQSNANFTKYCFFAGWGGDISDCKSESYISRKITVSADFEHFYLQVFDEKLKTYILECYDRKLNKIWSREFDETTSAVLDYTEKHIYLVANGSMYIINAQTGENSVEPKYIGSKTAIRKLEDGIILVSYKASDAVMKTDLSGNVLWTANFSYDMQNPDLSNQEPIVQIVNGNYVVQYAAYENNSPTGETYTAVVTPDGDVIFDDKAF